MKHSPLQQLLLQWMSILSIRQKVVLGMGSILGMLVVVAVFAIISLTTTQRDVVRVVDERQPLAMSSLALSESLDRANAALGFYLSSTEPVDKAAYEQALKDLDTLLVKIKDMPAVQRDPDTVVLVNAIGQGLVRYKNYQHTMTELATDFQKNFPGMSYSSQRMNPVAMNIQAAMQGMLENERDQKSSAARRKLVFELAELRQQWMNIIVGNRAYMAFRGQVALDNLNMYRQVFAEEMKKVETYAKLFTFEQADFYDQIKTLWPEFNKLMDEMIVVHSSDKWRTDSYMIRTEVGPLVQEIKSKLNTLVESQIQRNEADSRILVTDVVRTRRVVMAILMVALVVGGLGGWLITVSIVSPLRHAVAAMQDIAHGEGDLTRRLDAKGHDEIAQLGSSFNQFISKVQGIMTQVSGSTSQLAAAAEEMSLVVDSTKQGVQRQRQETELVATAMNEMVSTVQDVAQSAGNAASMTQQADSQANSGKHTVQRTIDAIETLANEVTKVLGVIQELEKNSDAIGTVLDVIQGIAEQTNLLALNAAIEAARAGEQGRGFAVVADEVRNLASRTSASTREIQTMIERLQSGARGAAEAMRGGNEQAQASVKKAAEAGMALEQITAAVTKIASMNKHMAEASRQQGEVAETINQNVTNISAVADDTARSTDGLAQSSIALAQLATELQGMVGQFKI
ncbi:MAG: methyl-accepting chemotaxis protein [Gammaproteobacteria bacterium]|nr:methyl-accepting chemotaxis protein [Gammaproteobacteria bacterium]